jgi:hypothetical protein
MQATTAGAIAASVSAIVGAASATVAAFSAWNSRRSAQASEAALRETRHERQMDGARRELDGLGVIYDHAMALIQALSIELRRDPAAVERKREALRRVVLVAGLTEPALSLLIEVDRALRPAEVAALREALTARSAALHKILTGEIN